MALQKRFTNPWQLLSNPLQALVLISAGDNMVPSCCVTPRRSRDICEQERAKAKRNHHIICYEFYVECSCGHKGRSRNHACPKCGARIFFGFGSMFNSALPSAALLFPYVTYVTLRGPYGITSL